MGRPALSEEQLEKEQARIRDAAQTLFEEGGHEAVTLRAISKAIGSSAMQPYRYFPGGKNEILAAVKAHAFDRFTEHLNEAAIADLNDIEALSAYCLAYVEFALNDPASFKLMFEHTVEGDVEYPLLAAAEARARRPVVELIARMVETRRLNVAADKLAQVLWASVHGLVMLQLSGQLKFGESVEDLTPILINTLRAGLLSKEGT